MQKWLCRFSVFFVPINWLLLMHFGLGSLIKRKAWQHTAPGRALVTRRFLSTMFRNSNRNYPIIDELVDPWLDFFLLKKNIYIFLCRQTCRFYYTVSYVQINHVVVLLYTRNQRGRGSKTIRVEPLTFFSSVVFHFFFTKWND